uniref:cytochrome c oxidase subunit II n=1 Tax=Marcia japonica TaxID=368935 RepID=UPI0022379594|nr:cytochrome c oxidase subunit II [Marcia japonica]UYR95099.1 cytochrome c oxidase subunit II [Marcia japonica]
MSWSQFGFPDPVTNNAERLFCYHDLVMVVVVFVLIVVGWFTMMSIFSFFFSKGQLDLGKKKDEWLEVIWTVSPAFFLFFIGFISLINLYTMNLGGVPMFSFSAVGHQWYWEYVYEISKSSSISKKSMESAEKIIMEVSDQWKDVFSELPEESSEFPEDSLGFPEESSGNPEESVCNLSLSEEIHKHSHQFMTNLVSFIVQGLRFKEEVKYLSKFYEKLLSSYHVGLIDGESIINMYIKFIGLSIVKFIMDFFIIFITFEYKMTVENQLYEKNEFNEMDISKILSGTNMGNSKEIFDMNIFINLLRSNEKEIYSLLFYSFIKDKSVRLRFDSYMVMEEDLTNEMSSMFGGFRRGVVTNPCFLCCGVKNEVLVSTVDVMHSWGVQELGIKIDAVPGRINSGMVVPKVPGFFYGFCYELCGTGHSEMPITAVVLDLESYNEALDIMLLKQINLE